ncbi:DUF1430 domain-containing protein [uncultured Clostridium sp.]|uniref:DUF1430 domain-containing protein n=1 Tax=uncultured Clostridium sp. TaxID=59620 RepID=UPI002609B599|nr:DUF1430 domain-containing protein [uncultured Clostridium sp.]
MKKLINILVLTIFMFSFFLGYKEFENRKSLEIKNIENKLENSYDILIPSIITKLPRNDQYEFLAEVSENALSSLFFTRIDRVDGKEKIIKYIYTIDDTYMNSIDIRKGKKLDKTLMNSEFFLSTEETGDSNQIGVIDNSNNDFILEIRTLHSMLEDGMNFTGICTINLPNDKPVNYYMGKIEELFGVENISFNKAEVIGEEFKTNYNYIILLTLILSFILVYKYISLYKELGIKKLLGYSNFDICKDEFKSLLSSILFSALISIILMSLILFDVYSILYFEFITKILFIYLCISIIIIFSGLIPVSFIYKIRLLNFIKNKKYSKNILIINSIIKSILILAIILIININLSILKNINENYSKSYNRWTDFNNYVVLNLDDLDFDVSESNEFRYSQNKLYKIFNEKGAVFADFGNYEQISLDMNQNLEYYKRTSIINSNYLNENPIYDVDGQKIEISENDKDWIILVPENFKSDTEVIYNYYNEWLKTYDMTNETKIKIIWTKSGQKYFSYNVNVNPKENNYIKDPIVMIGTENGLFPGWNQAIFNIQGNPMKIKVEDIDSLYGQIRPIVESTGINAASLRINFANEEVLSILNEYKNIFYTLILTIIIALILVIVIVFQNIHNFFEQNKLELVIKTFNGYDKFTKYKEYFKGILLNYSILLVIGIITNMVICNILISVLLIGFLAEMIIGVAILEFNNRKEIVPILKGEY